MTNSNLEIAWGIADAMNDGNVPRLLSFLATDVEVDEPTGVPWAGRFHGHDGFQQLLGIIGSRLRSEIIQLDVIEGAGSLFTVRMRARFTSPATGRSIETSVAEVDEIADGLVRRIDVFYKEPAQVTEIFTSGG